MMDKSGKVKKEEDGWNGHASVRGNSNDMIIRLATLTGSSLALTRRGKSRWESSVRTEKPRNTASEKWSRVRTVWQPGPQMRTWKKGSAQPV